MQSEHVPLQAKKRLRARRAALDSFELHYVALSSFAAENGRLPAGDEGRSPETPGQRGIIWVNHLARYLDHPELEPGASNFHELTWEDITGKYAKAAWVCPGVLLKIFVPDSKAGLGKIQLDRIKAQTPDPIGGVGYNVKPSAPENKSANANWNTHWTDTTFNWAALSKMSWRGVFASSCDWHLEKGGARAYDRFGTNRAVMTFFDGSSRFVNRTEFDKALDIP